MSNERPDAVDILYQNHRGEVAWRRIVPVIMYYSTDLPWHPEIQHLLAALDLDRNEPRTFAMKDVLCWGRENYVRLTNWLLTSAIHSTIPASHGPDAVLANPSVMDEGKVNWSPDEILKREG